MAFPDETCRESSRSGGKASSAAVHSCCGGGVFRWIAELCAGERWRLPRV